MNARELSYMYDQTGFLYDEKVAWKWSITSLQLS